MPFQAPLCCEILQRKEYMLDVHVFISVYVIGKKQNKMKLNLNDNTTN